MAKHLRLIDAPVPPPRSSDRDGDETTPEITALLFARHRAIEELLVELDKGDRATAAAALVALRRQLAGQRCIADQVLLPLVRAHAPGLSSRLTRELGRLTRLEPLLPAEPESPSFRSQASEACTHFETSLANLDDLLAELEAQVAPPLLRAAGDSARSLTPVRAAAVGLRLV